jgi:hypothetical protein
MTRMIDEDFEYFYRNSGFGPAVDTRPVGEATLTFYRGKLPEKLLEYWKAYGFSGYGSGLFWMTDPSEYSEVLNAWIYGTPLYGTDDFHVIGRTAFGRLMVWGTRTGPCMTILSMTSMIFPKDNSKWMSQGKGDFLASSWVERLDKVDLDEEDEAGKPLFERAVKQLGHLAPDEMYAFTPALRAGGPCRLDHLKKVKAVEHLMLLAQLGEPEIMLDIVKEAKDRGVWK